MSLRMAAETAGVSGQPGDAVIPGGLRVCDVHRPATPRRFGQKSEESLQACRRQDAEESPDALHEAPVGVRNSPGKEHQAARTSLELTLPTSEDVVALEDVVHLVL